MEKSIIILVPMYVAYIIMIGFLMFRKRFKAIKSKEVNLTYFKDYQGNAPYELEVYKNHFENQFQMPVLFIVACIAVLTTKTITTLTVIMCYLFFISRIAHSYFHLGSNHLRLRALSYLLGALLVLGLWIEFAIRFLNLT